MCVRYNTVDARWERYLRRKNVWVAIELPPQQTDLFQGNMGMYVAPGESAALELKEGHWGLLPPFKEIKPQWKKGFYNARIEGSEERGEGIENMPAFRDAFRHRRCLVPMASYYENADVEGAELRYVEVLPTEDEAFLMAGLWQPPNLHSDAPTYTIITTPSVGELAEINTRRLARLDDDMIPLWMAPSTPLKELKALVLAREDEPVRLRAAEPPRRPVTKANRPSNATEDEPSLFN